MQIIQQNSVPRPASAAASAASDLSNEIPDIIERPQSARGNYDDTEIPVADDKKSPLPSSAPSPAPSAEPSPAPPPPQPTKVYSDSEDDSSDEEDTRDQEGKTYTPKGEEVS